MSDLPGVHQCQTCPNLMRPHGTTTTQYPGTAGRANTTTCMSCSNRTNRKTKTQNNTPHHKSALNGYITERRNRLRKTVNT